MATATRTTSPSVSVMERYVDVDPSRFTDELDKDWSFLQSQKELVQEGVRDGTLAPITAIGIMACASAQLFAYAAFHGQPTSAELIDHLGRPGTRN